MEEHDCKYNLIVNKKRICVSKEIYKAYYKQKEHETYLDKLSKRYNLSMEECEEKGIQFEYILHLTEESLEDLIIKKDMLVKLGIAMVKLTEQERLLIYELFFKGKSERQLSKETGIPQKTINDRKHSILMKLKKLIEN